MNAKVIWGTIFMLASATLWNKGLYVGALLTGLSCFLVYVPSGPMSIGKRPMPRPYVIGTLILGAGLWYAVSPFK